MIGLSDNGEHDGVDFDSGCDGVSGDYDGDDVTTLCENLFLRFLIDEDVLLVLSQLSVTVTDALTSATTRGCI